MPHFREDNPQLEIEEIMKRGRHPFLQAEYSETQAVSPPPNLPADKLLSFYFTAFTANLIQ